MNYQSLHFCQPLSDISQTVLHSNSLISQSNLDNKQLMFRLSSNSQNPHIEFKKKQRTTYFHTSIERGNVKSISPQNNSWQTPANSTKAFLSKNASQDQNFVSKRDSRKRRIGLIKMENFDFKVSKQKLQFSKYKPRNLNKLNKQNSSPVHFQRTISQQKISVFEQRKQKSEPIKLQQFNIGKRLGKGKFGEVYMVREKRTNFICAMKKISKSVINQEQFQEQLFRQVKIQLFLNHPNLVKMYGFFFDLENIYILLEYCSCGTLYQRMCQGPKLSQPETSQVISQVLSGLDQLHYHRIFHRDLKPQNILMVHGIVKIGDFGWSVHDKKDEVRKTICGTPLYFSPEIIVGQNYDQKIDIWSVGIMTYEILISKNPFKIKTENQLIRIVEQEISFPQNIMATQCAKDFILKMLTKNPKLRLEASELLNHPFIKVQ